MRKSAFLLFISLFFVTSCHLSGIFNGGVTLGGDDATFVKNGYSLPAFGHPKYSGDIPELGGVKMFQSSRNYILTMEVVNPAKMDLKYRVYINKPDAVKSVLSGNMVHSGVFSSLNNTLSIPFSLTNAADKNNIQFSMEIESSMRSYDPPSFGSFYVNTRPSQILPKKNGNGDDATDSIWLPVIENNKAIIYWDYSPLVTDTDIDRLELLYEVGERKGVEKIPFDGSAGIKSYSVDNVVSVDDINFSLIVYDNEGLDSGFVSTGSYSPQRSPKPVFTRGNDADLNKVTITADSGCTLFVSEDKTGGYKEVSSPYEVILQTKHFISAYAALTGVFDSETVSGDYIAKYVVTFDSSDAVIKSNPEYSIVDYGECVVRPIDPARTGYAFVGWYKDAAFTQVWDFSSEGVLSSMTLYAKWTQALTVTFKHSPDYQSLVFTSNRVIAGVGETVTLTPSNTELAANGSNWQWFINGDLQSGNDSHTFSFSKWSADIGSYTVNCAVLYENVLYSGSIVVTFK